VANVFGDRLGRRAPKHRCCTVLWQSGTLSAGRHRGVSLFLRTGHHRPAGFERSARDPNLVILDEDEWPGVSKDGGTNERPGAAHRAAPLGGLLVIAPLDANTLRSCRPARRQLLDMRLRRLGSCAAHCAGAGINTLMWHIPPRPDI